MKEFRYATFPQDISFGAGALDKLDRILAYRKWSRALLITTGSQRRNGNIARIEKLLGGSLVATFDATQPHVPQSNVDATVQLARDTHPDVLIALGGGSPIGVAKATSYSLHSPLSTLHMAPPLLAIPTTYAGSEMTPLFGVTRERDGITKKETASDNRIIPQVVLYDPTLTLDLPREMTASTGINAFAHCVEAVYSITRNPLSTAAALEGTRLIYNSLLRCYENGSDLAARSEMLQGAYLAGVSLENVAMGLHHGVCHVLGGTANIPHGIANAIILPHTIRFNADTCAADLARIAQAIGIPPHDPYAMTMDAALCISEWVTRMDLPTRLRDVGIPESALPQLAALAFQNKTVQNNPKKIPNAETLETFLRAAW